MLSRPAVELRNPRVPSPIETAGTGLAPEASVRVRVDVRGRVVEVDVSKIVPSTRYDALFVRSVEETLAEWRYAPKLENGAPVETELSWTLQFMPRSGVARPRFEINDPRDGRAEARRSRYLRLERERREEVLREVVAQMTHHLEGEVVRRESPRFVVLTDSDSKVAAAIANNLEALYGVLAEMFSGQIDLQPEPLKVIAVVYERADRYRAMRSTAEHFERSDGYYHPAGALAFHLEWPRSDGLLGALLHEATHAFLDRHVVAPSTVVPRWLSEGFAEYMGNSKVEKKRLVPGKTRRRKAYLTHSGAAFLDTAAWLDAAHAKDAVRKRKALTLDEIFNAGPEIFYGERRDLYYPMSWFLVHYLRHGEEDWAAERFPTFVTYVAEGFAPGPAFEKVYGRSIASMEESFRDYVLGF